MVLAVMVQTWPENGDYYNEDGDGCRVMVLNTLPYT